MKNIWLALSLGLLFSLSTAVKSQPNLVQDYTVVMEIPSVISMQSSPAHLYVLSDKEGLAVFRTQSNDLNWLYSSSGMEQRGHTITADVRFAYLFGNSRRLTVLEPTSVLGVYSSTLMPSQPIDAKRIDENLYVALGNKGLGKVSLHSPATVDSTMDPIERSQLSDENIIDLEGTSTQLFALAEGEKLFLFNYSNQQLSLAKEFNLSENLSGIYLINNTLFGSDSEGGIYKVAKNGDLSRLGSIDEAVSKIEGWNNWLIIKGRSNRLWTSYRNQKPELWKDDNEAGNYFSVIKDNLWLSEQNKISKIISSDQNMSASGSTKNSTTQGDGSFSLKSIPDQTVSHSKPLLFPIEVTGSATNNGVEFTYQSAGIKNAEIRGNSFYWNPTRDDIGIHDIKIIATSASGQKDSQTFKIDIRSYNAPPRFATLTPISIPMGEPFTLPIEAIDPDGVSKDLVRFIGVNMPDGSSINEATGSFHWTPGIRQAGKNEFRVIATDQYGAASSAHIVITVVEDLERQDSGP